MSILLDFYKRWKIFVNPDKTELMEKNTNHQIIFPLIIFDTPIVLKKRVKYLVITFSKHVSFKPDISTHIQMVFGAEQKLYRLNSPNLTVCSLPRTNLLIYKTIIRSGYYFD